MHNVPETQTLFHYFMMNFEIHFLKHCSYVPLTHFKQLHIIQIILGNKSGDCERCIDIFAKFPLISFIYLPICCSI